MKKIIMFIMLVGLLPTRVCAHLCNDVFMQAKDNLVVKVDVRDGQLRISKSAKFRVYLLNTMDRPIEEIRLDVMTDDFDVKVSPSREWKNFPMLSVLKKQYFEVELRRKSATESGKYTINLRLFGRDCDFKTVNIDEALDVMRVPENSSPLKVDGDASRSEWNDSLLCTSLYQYGFLRSYMENIPSDVQTRFRFSRYQDTLYCLIDFMQQNRNDVARIYVAQNHESKPTVIVAHLQQKTAFIDGMDNLPIHTAVKGNRMELELPLDVLQIKNQTSFYVNVTRDFDETTTYWRGNTRSVMDPIVYANFVF